MADSVVDSILAARYYRVGEKSFEDVCRRVANAPGETPEETKEYFEGVVSPEFLPNPPTMMNGGTPPRQRCHRFASP